MLANLNIRSKLLILEIVSSAGLIGVGSHPTSASRALSFASARPAFVSALSMVTMSLGMFRGAPSPYHPIAS